MSIRSRLVVMCLVVALLPAVPLTFVVQSLLDKSFNVGLNDTMEEALRSGVSVSRDHFDAVLADFQQDVTRLTRGLDPARVDSSTAVELLLRARHGDTRVHGIITATGTPRSMLLGTWRDALLFYHQIDPFFVRQSQSVLEARQLFAKLRLTQGDLTRSFFLAFVIIYLVCLVITLGVALVMAERLADPIRRLVRGADAVAEGHWDTHVDARAGGETGRLVRAFNGMVERLDTQRRRLVETEKMAAWQDVARHLAHEIKNPLLPIRLTVEELRDQYQGGDANYRTMLEDSARVVGEELGHLQTLVRDFSEFAKMPELSARESSFAQLVHDVAGIYPQVESDIREDRGRRPFHSTPTSCGAWSSTSTTTRWVSAQPPCGSRLVSTSGNCVWPSATTAPASPGRTSTKCSNPTSPRAAKARDWGWPCRAMSCSCTAVALKCPASPAKALPSPLPFRSPARRWTTTPPRLLAAIKRRSRHERSSALRR
jgi:nitrogen fixation/metabolism regulation signal transduction histidine kinase